MFDDYAPCDESEASLSKPGGKRAGARESNSCEMSNLCEVADDPDMAADIYQGSFVQPASVELTGTAAGVWVKARASLGFTYEPLAFGRAEKQWGR